MLAFLRACEGGRLGIIRPVTRWLARCKHRDDSFLNPNNSQYIDHIYNSWLKDPKSVEPSWDTYFKLLASDVKKDGKSTAKEDDKNWIQDKPLATALIHPKNDEPSQADDGNSTLDIDATIRAYQVTNISSQKLCH